MNKYVVMVMGESDTPEGRGRMVHAMKAVNDLKASGAEVKMVFAGIGVTWMSEIHKMEHPFVQHYQPLWESVKEDVVGVCNFCATGRFKTGDETEALGFGFLGDEGQHLNISELISDGSQLLTF